MDTTVTDFVEGQDRRMGRPKMSGGAIIGFAALVLTLVSGIITVTWSIGGINGQVLVLQTQYIGVKSDVSEIKDGMKAIYSRLNTPVRR
jgi:hypothetical protein